MKVSLWDSFPKGTTTPCPNCETPLHWESQTDVWSCPSCPLAVTGPELSYILLEQSKKGVPGTE